MAVATLSTSRLVSAVAKVETTYGTDVTPAGGTDDVTLIDSENPVSVQIGTQRIQPHTSSFTKTAKDLITTQLAQVSMQGLMQGPATLSTVDNGWNGQSALFQSCGITQTIATPGTSDIVLTPSTKTALKSATVKVDLDGTVHALTGVYGTALTLSADTATNVKPRWNYTGLGLYVAPTITTLSGVTAPDRAQSVLGATASITPSGGGAYNAADGLILDAFSLSISPTVGQVTNVLDSTGIERLLHVNRDPMLSITLAVDLQSGANLAYDDLFPDLTGSVDHAVNILWGTTPGKWEITVPTAQLVGISPPSTKNGYRVVTLTYNLRHATANTEWSINCGNPS